MGYSIQVSISDFYSGLIIIATGATNYSDPSIRPCAPSKRQQEKLLDVDRRPTMLRESGLKLIDRIILTNGNSNLNKSRGIRTSNSDRNTNRCSHCPGNSSSPNDNKRSI